MSREILGLLALTSLLPLPALGDQIKVKSGDTLSEIAEEHKVSVQEIMRLNGLQNPNQLKAGSSLNLPSNTKNQSAENEFHKVKSGETISSIALKYGLKSEDIISLNDLQNSNFISVGQSIRLPQRQSEKIIKDEYIYTVVSGDTLSKIALNNGVSQQELIDLNDLQSAHQVYINQKLKLPGESQSKKSINQSRQLTSNKVKYHTVSSGDTLSTISRKYGVPINELINVNSLDNPNSLIIGKRLLLNNEEGSTYSKSEASPSKQRTLGENITATNVPSVAMSLKESQWRTYGPLQIDWSSWRAMGGSFVAPSLNKQNKPLYLAVNCLAKQINSTGANGEWKEWNLPKASFEHDLIRDVCRANGIIDS